MGIESITQHTDWKAVIPKAAADWEEWVSATHHWHHHVQKDDIGLLNASFLVRYAAIGGLLLPLAPTGIGIIFCQVETC